MSRACITAVEIASDVRDGAMSVSDATSAFLEISREHEPRLNALLHSIEGGDSKGGARTGPLAGVPVLLDDGICASGMPTTCASRMLEGWIPPYNSAAVELLEAAGATICGKCNMDEFGIGCSTETSVFGPVSNPHDPGRTSGGSAGGCAAAVAAGYAPLAIACDTGGSVLQPASFCGVYGLRPTYGLVSRWGITALAPSMDQLGIFSLTVEDIALALSVLSRHDSRDGTSAGGERPDYLSICKQAAAEGALKGKRIALIREAQDANSSSDISRALERIADLCRDQGAEVVDLSLPLSFKHSLPCFQLLLAAEASSSLARFDGIRYGLSSDADSLNDLYLKNRAAGLGTKVKTMAAAGTYILGGERYEDCYLRASSARAAIARELTEALSKCDLAALPATPTVAFKRGEFADDPFGMRSSQAFTVQASLAGLPALVMDGSDGGLPAGVQFIASRWGEATLLATASIIERERGR